MAYGMLEEFIKTLCGDLEIKDVPKMDEKTKSLVFPFGDFEIAMKELEKGFHFKAIIDPCPNKKREDLFIKLMQANLIGQGTGGAVIGVDKQEKSLTLSLALAYEMNYPTFKENLEDFINYLVYWKEAIQKAQEESIY